tara:strand:- start:2025 stop:3107 length:1083 start_codon:yes stop_codon:yes gene_type:complete
MNDLDVLMLTCNDWANTGYRFSKCLKMLGLNVKILKGRKHVFDYPEQASVIPELAGNNPMSKMLYKYPVIIEIADFDNSIVNFLAKKAKVIHFHATTFISNNWDLHNKHVVVQHGGTTYRLHPESANQLFNQFCDAAIIQCPDLLNLGANNEHLIYYPVDTDLIQPTFDKKDDKLIIGHFPSRPESKGTAGILNVITKLESDPELRDKFKYIGTREVVTGNHGSLPWKEHLDRVSNCDVLIETLNLSFEGKVFGEWGNTAIESAALGKVVLTNSLTPDLYSEEYGDCALNLVNSEDELEKNLRRLILLDSKSLKQEKIKSREWVVNTHSMKATAIRLWERIYHKFFPELTPDICQNNQGE